MNNKKNIVTIIILMLAFIAGWGIYRYGNIFPKYENERDNNNTTSDGNNFNKETVQSRSGLGQMIRSLDLSAEQISKFSQMEVQYRERLAIYLARLDTIDMAILNEVKKEIPDLKKLDSLAQQSGKMQYALKKATAEHFIQIKSICTPEQQKRFQEVISELSQYRRGQGRGEGRGLGRRQQRGWKNRQK
ncbi:Spy/CpxP family protein refolding chaperone [Thermophagus sp. OGC60D27]|uniref:Spy/CpxP family protein refolding chaperone n=1 Tax=Thermophagus sp. OGC60D27 TaxID=3458415 RepID=UPI0040377B0C